jgi:hypothetical protein
MILITGASGTVGGAVLAEVAGGGACRIGLFTVPRRRRRKHRLGPRRSWGISRIKRVLRRRFAECGACFLYARRSHNW